MTRALEMMAIRPRRTMGAEERPDVVGIVGSEVGEDGTGLR